MTRLILDCFWLPASHGGRRSEPHPDLRLGIRWQRHVFDNSGTYRDVQFEQLSVNPSTRQGIAQVKLVSEVPGDWLQHGELVEIVEGYKVVAVGFVVEEALGGKSHFDP